jgi:hypothetical protein
MKMGLKGMHFATMEDIKSNATAKLWKIPNEAFHQCFHHGRIDVACVCERNGPTLKVIR